MPEAPFDAMRRSPRPRLLVINNMPSYYRTLPFQRLLEAYADATGGSGQVAYQVRRDSHARGEWFFTADDDFPYRPYFSSPDTTRAPGRTGYPLRIDARLWWHLRPDHVFAAGWDSPMSITAAAYARARRVPFGVWVESNPTTSRKRGGAADLARRTFLRSADFAVVPTAASAAYVDDLAGRPMRAIPLKNPVSLERLPNRSDPARAKRLVFLGDLSLRKGFDYFARAVELGREQGWTGEAWGRDTEGLAAGTPDNLKVREPAALAEILPSLLPSDVLVIASRVDPAPLTYSEALALGLRVLVSDQIAYGEDAGHGDGSACIDPTDARGLVAAAETLLRGPRPSVERAATVTPEHWAGAIADAFLTPTPRLKP